MQQKFIEQIVNGVCERLEAANKNVMDAREAAAFLGVSMSHLYKLCHTRKIPYYKPQGKLSYFKREELEQWLLKNRVASDEELERQARELIRKGTRKGARR